MTHQSDSASREVLADRVVAEIAFDKSGLVPAIAQRQSDGEILMLAWMNAESLRETLTSGQVCYWSRSRQTLWRKGETSGHRQKLVELRYDCDKDAVLLLVEQVGPACHTYRRSCFYHAVRDGEVQVILEPVEAAT